MECLTTILYLHSLIHCNTVILEVGNILYEPAQEILILTTQANAQASQYIHTVSSEHRSLKFGPYTTSIAAHKVDIAIIVFFYLNILQTSGACGESLLCSHTELNNMEKRILQK